MVKQKIHWAGLVGRWGFMEFMVINKIWSVECEQTPQELQICVDRNIFVHGQGVARNTDTCMGVVILDKPVLMQIAEKQSPTATSKTIK